MKHEFGGIPIRENLPPPEAGCPFVCIQFNYSHCFLMARYFNPELAILDDHAVAIFRIHPKKK